MKLALLTAAVGGDNAGDAFIEDAVRRLVQAEEYHRFPLTTALTPEMVAAINRLDAAVICGTNLYQSRFACHLDEATIRALQVPLIPLGIGASARIGRIPRMKSADARAVRLLHARRRSSSVRDGASWRFLRSLGIKNVRLTGCPVLFHGLERPTFDGAGNGYTLTPRARLLHIRQIYDARQLETLHTLCARYRPRLIAQSPYDLPLCRELSQRHGLETVDDAAWQAAPYVPAAREQKATFGFRLHFGMLSLAYGKPAFFVAHDSRVWEFCRLVGWPCFDIRGYSDENLIFNVETNSFPADGFCRRWQELAEEMNGFLAENGLASRLRTAPPTASERPTAPFRISAPAAPARRARKPRVLLLVDRPNWAYDHSARQIAKKLAGSFRFDIKYVRHKPRIRAKNYDLIYVFFWGEDYYKKFQLPPERVVKELSSHRWEDDPRYGPCTPHELGHKFLRDCESVICTSRRLTDVAAEAHPHVYHTPNGIDPQRFRPLKERTGPIRFGWAGKANSPLKGLEDILLPACQGRWKLRVAPGRVSHARMNRFYNAIDVFAVASRSEGEPLTLLEAMAAGCFPVACDVGIVPELIRHGDNGLIVERSPEAFREAFAWCAAHPERVRRAGLENAHWIRRERSWDATAPFFQRAFWETLARAERPKFRNDDVAWDTDLAAFRRFCETFHRHGFTQVHGVTLRGRLNVLAQQDGEPVEYPGEPSLGRLPNERIRELSAPFRVEDRPDLIDYLNRIPDEIALHGLYHTDYARMTPEEQHREIGEGLALLQRLFPEKHVRYFIAPFNRVGRRTARICAEHGLHLLASDGVHLEAELERLTLVPGSWHRYHHHRFYPESAFDYYDLSLELLDAALARNAAPQGHAPRDLGLVAHLAPRGLRRRLFGWLQRAA